MRHVFFCIFKKVWRYREDIFQSTLENKLGCSFSFKQREELDFVHETTTTTTTTTTSINYVAKFLERLLVGDIHRVDSTLHARVER
jgi:hypothetical protein